MKNRLKRIIEAGKVAVGGEISTPCPDIAEIMASIGFDWIFVDTEHAPFDIYALQTVLQAIKGTDTVPVVRPAWNDRVLIKRVLDVGAFGVVIPWVNTKEDAEAAVSYCKYPPNGLRGWGPRRASLYYMRTQDYLETADDEILVFAQIETAEAMKNLEDIISVEGIDGVLVGPADLSFSLRVPLQFQHPLLKRAIEKVVTLGKAAGLPIGILCGGPDVAKEYVKMGFQMITIGNDVTLLRNGCESALSAFARNTL